MTYTDSNNLIMLVNGAGLPARVLIPMIADRIGPLNMILLGVTSVGITILSWLAVDSIPGLYIFTAFLGITSGATQSLMPTTIASITRRLDTVGTRLGMCFSIMSVASLTGPPIGGALQGADGGSWTGAQAWAGVSALVGAVFLLASRTFKVGWTLKANC
jgi:MFS family permease